jgi:glucosamine--fructose-6-phosphate aminotransferase (isomerizing)
LIEFAGIGINAWAAAEGALKIREAAYVASEGMACESVLHGPAVALAENDAFISLSTGETDDERLIELTTIVKQHGTATYEFIRGELGNQLSIFPLTVIVQKIAVEAAETLGVDPDSFGYQLPGHKEAWEAITL